ncbi:MAG: helix-turn-helix domain-containing protein [Candidatus Melainabacteria bacterium]|nr:helix-turn-helix domain-containing protein [Candidatus Melainabacteria bacterium]
MKVFGDYVRERRQELRIGLREFCSTLELDPSRWSKVERGTLQPPKDEDILAKIAKVLKIPKSGAEWEKFRDLAIFSRGEIPQDIMEDKELVACLPLVFRTLGREKPTKEQLLSLADLIRHSNRSKDIEEQ